MAIEETMSSDGLECPYCHHINHVEGEDHGMVIDKQTDWECSGCERSFMASADVSIDFKAKAIPCADDKHEWDEWSAPITSRYGSKKTFVYRDCNKCSESQYKNVEPT